MIPNLRMTVYEEQEKQGRPREHRERESNTSILGPRTPENDKRKGGCFFCESHVPAC